MKNKSEICFREKAEEERRRDGATMNFIALWMKNRGYKPPDEKYLTKGRCYDRVREL